MTYVHVGLETSAVFLVANLSSELIMYFVSLCDRICDWSERLATDPEVPSSIPALPDFLKSSGYEIGYTQPRECNLGATWKK
jgi:hypothetical protein